MGTLEIYKTIFDSVPDAMLIADSQGKIVLANKRVKVLFGYETHELIGQDIGLLVPTRFSKNHRAHISKFCRRPRTKEMGRGLELAAKKSDGTEFPVEIGLSFVQVNDQNYGIASVREVTDRLKTENEIKQNEADLKKAQRIAKLGLWTYDIIDDDFRWSDELYRILGMAPNEIKGSSDGFYNCVHPDDRDGVRRSYYGSLEKKKPFDIDYRLKLTDGRIKYVNEIGEFVYDNNGNAIKSFGTVQDITGHREAEQELRIAKQKIEESEKQFRELYEKSGDAILIIENGTFTNCNRATIDMLVYRSKEEFLNSHPSKLSPKTQPDGSDSFEKAEKMMGTALEKGTHRFEWTHTKSNGEYFPVEVLLTVISNEPSNKVIHCVWRDITERKIAEKHLFESNLRFSQLSNNTSDVFWLGDVSDLEDIKWLYVNPAFEQVWERAAEALYKDPAVWSNSIHKEDQKRLGISFMDFLHEKNKEFNVGFRIIRPDKTIRHIHSTGNLIKDHNGKIIRIAGISRDVTQQKMHEEKMAARTAELERSMTLLENKNKELEQFTYIASHDLQEPLQTVSSFVELLKEEYQDILDDNAGQYIDFIDQSTERMKNLISGLLDYSRIGREKIRSTVDCNEILGHILDDLRTVIAESGAKIESGHLPILRAYPTELGQLFQNLIGNAIKFVRPGVSPLITIFCQQQDEGWLFEFKDNGIGIEEKHRERIFIIFKRLHSRKEYEGTGIGLAHCRKIVELHHGKIWVEPVPNEGSKFCFTIKDH